MAYTKTNWVDGATELNAVNLNKIEDGIEAVHNTVDTHGHNASEITTDTTRRFMTDTEKSKLAGIEDGANNFTYTHPATHSVAMITGLSTVATSGSYNDLSNKPTSLPANGGNADTLDGLNSTDFMRMYHKNGYYGLAPNGSDTSWVRTPTVGIIPFQSGGHGSLGTSSWPFSTVYSNNVYIRGTALPKITVSSTAPSSPQTNDIWIEI